MTFWEVALTATAVLLFWKLIGIAVREFTIFNNRD